MCRADTQLDLLRRALTDEQVELALDVADQILVEGIARNADALARHDAAETDDGDIRCTAADVDDH